MVMGDVKLLEKSGGKSGTWLEAKQTLAGKSRKIRIKAGAKFCPINPPTEGKTFLGYALRHPTE
jgi:hypothetical protein